MKKNALGRGLDALFPQGDLAPSQVLDIPVNEIDPNPGQPRRAFSQDALEQLSASILELGLLQPILVVRDGERYRIVAGERRYRACRLAGLKTIPCIVRDFSGQRQMEAALVENLQREDLNPMEKARAVEQLMRSGAYTQEQTAKILSCSRPVIANLLRLLDLPDEIAQALREGRLSEGHARVLLSVQDESKQLRLFNAVLRDGLSVRALEALCKAQDHPQKKQRASVAPEFRSFEKMINEKTGLHAKLKGDLNRGQLILSYKTREELEWLYEKIEQMNQ